VVRVTRCTRGIYNNIVNIPDPRPSSRTAHIRSPDTMTSGPPSKNIEPPAELGPDVNKYYYYDSMINNRSVSVGRNEFIEICQNASVFPNKAFTALVAEAGGLLPESNNLYCLLSLINGAKYSAWLQ